MLPGLSSRESLSSSVIRDLRGSAPTSAPDVPEEGLRRRRRGRIRGLGGIVADSGGLLGLDICSEISSGCARR